MAVIEITTEELLNDCDWAHVFGEANEPNCDATPEPLPPEDASVDLSMPKRSDVAEIIAAVNGENDSDAWDGVFRLNDGRYLLASGSCDYTGWD